MSKWSGFFVGLVIALTAVMTLVRPADTLPDVAVAPPQAATSNVVPDEKDASAAPSSATGPRVPAINADGAGREPAADIVATLSAGPANPDRRRSARDAAVAAPVGSGAPGSVAAPRGDDRPRDGKPEPGAATVSPRGRTEVDALALAPARVTNGMSATAPGPGPATAPPRLAGSSTASTPALPGQSQTESSSASSATETPVPDAEIADIRSPPTSVDVARDSDGVAETDLAARAVAFTATPEAATLPFPSTSPPSDDARQWYAFWQPFSSELSARGFRARLERITGLDYRVVKLDSGRYHVAFGYADEQSRVRNLVAIEEATGLSLGSGSF